MKSFDASSNLSNRRSERSLRSEQTAICNAEDDAARVDVQSAGRAEDQGVYLDFGHLALFTGQQINRLVREQLAREGFADARDAHGYVFQHLVDGRKSISSLGERMGISQQAASKRIAEMVELGYVDVDPASVGRTRLIAISERGWALITTARSIRNRVHNQFADTLDSNDVATTTRLLRQVLDQLGGLTPASQRRVREPE